LTFILLPNGIEFALLIKMGCADLRRIETPVRFVQSIMFHVYKKMFAKIDHWIS